MRNSIVAILLLSSAVAFANEFADEQANRADFIGERTRAEVKAELQSGRIDYSDYAGNVRQPSQAAGRDRSAVRAEAVRAARTRVIHELF